MIAEKRKLTFSFLFKCRSGGLLQEPSPRPVLA